METIIAFLNIIAIALFCYWLWRTQELPLRKFYWHALAAKLSAGILLGIIHAALYSDSDTFFMFQSATKLSQQARIDYFTYLDYLWSGGTAGYYAGVERTNFFIKVTSVLALITYDNYWLSSLYFSLFSFLAAWKLTKYIWLNFPGVGIPAAVALLFFPDSVFWASGIIKESLAMTGIYLLTALFLQLWLKQRISFLYIIVGIIAVWVVWQVKYYFIGLFLPVLFATWLTRYLIEKRKISKVSVEFGTWFLIFVTTCLLATFVHPNFSLNRLVDILVSTNQGFLNVSSPNDVIHFYNLDHSWFSIVINSPWALISGLFRPFIWEADSLLKVVVSVENLVLFILIVMSVRSVFGLKESPHRLLTLAILMYVVSLCVFLAISTPNFGTLVRYRVGFLPFLLILGLNQPMVVKTLSRTFNVSIE